MANETEPRNPRLVFSLAKSPGPYRPLSFRQDSDGKIVSSLHDMILKAGFQAGDRVVMTLALQDEETG